MNRRWTLAFLALTVCTAAPAPAPADAAPLSRADAAKKALAAIDARQGDDALIVFGLRRPVAPGTLITQAGPIGNPVAAHDASVSARLARAGVDAIQAAKVMQTRKRSWLFYADEGPNQAFEHPGRVILVERSSGHVRVSRRLRWVPLINGRLPSFFQTPQDYASKDFRVFDRPYKQHALAAKARARAAQRTPEAAAAQQRLADALAAEYSCALRVSDSLGDFYDFGRVDKTRASLGRVFKSLGQLNGGFVTQRYLPSDGRTPTQAAQRLINAGCRDLMLYVAGSATKSGTAGVVVGLRPRASGEVEWHTLTASSIERLVHNNRGVTFKLVFDAPYAGRIAARLSDERNVSVLLTAGGADEPSFSYLPQILGGSGVLRNPSNPSRLLEFSNGLIIGLERFTSITDEIDNAIAEQAAGRSDSVMAWMLARALDLGPSPFSAQLLGRRNQRVPLTTVASSRPRPPGPPVNHTPIPATPPYVTREDTPRDVFLLALDPDHDPLTFEVIAPTTHGALTGTAPFLRYAPDRDFNGRDELTYRVSDGRGGTAMQTVPIIVLSDNDTPAVVGGPGFTPPTFTEDGSAVVIDNALTVSDADSSQLEGATAEITVGLVSGDELSFTPPAGSGITGTYNSGTGVLTLVGTSSVANYQAALRTIAFDSTSQDPGTARTVRFRADDGDEFGVPANRDVTVVPVNDAPVNTAPATATTDEDTTLTLSGADAVSVSDVDARDDALMVTLTATNGALTLGGTTGLSFTVGDGTADALLVFTGTQSAITTALSGLAFTPAADYNGSGAGFQIVTDDQTHNGTGGAESDADNVAITVDPVNDAPENTLPAEGALDVDEDGSITTSAFSIADVDSGSDAMQVELKVLHGKLDVAAGGALTGDNTDTVKIEGTRAQINTSLASVKYSPDLNYNGSDTLTMETSDLGHNGSGGTKTDTDTFGITVSAENDAPVLTKPGAQTVDEDTALTFSSGNSNAISVDDEDSETDDVQVKLSVSNGKISDGGAPATTLTLTGSLTTVNAALDGLVYQPSQNYNGGDTLSIDVDDLGHNGSGPNGTASDSVAITMNAVNDKPVVTTTSTGATTFTEGQATDPVVDPGVTVTDVEDHTISGATVKIDPGYANDASPADHDTLDCTPQHGITCSFDASSGTLTLSNTATAAQYEDVLQSVTFHNDSQSSSTAARTVTFKVTDTGPGTLTSDGDDRTVNVVRVNDKPVVTTNTATATAYTENDGPTVVDSSVSVSDVDSTTLTGATVTISSGHHHPEDVLSATGGSGVIVDGYNSSTGVLTLSGIASIAAYETALEAVKYQNTSDDPFTDTRTVSFQVNGGASAFDLSDAAPHDVTVAAVNDKPVVLTSGGATTFQEPASGPPTAVVIDGGPTGVQIGDVDSTLLNRVTVAITTGHQSSDVLAYTTNHGIEASYDSPNGVLTLEPEGLATTASLADFQAAAREVTFSTPSTSPGLSRTITFRARDNETPNAESDAVATAQKSITVNNVNAAPTIADLSGSVAYAENGPPVQLDNDAVVSDPDGDNLIGGTVDITNFKTGDVLEFTATGNVDGDYDNGVLTITGTDTAGNYETFLRSVQYRTASDTPNTDDRAIEFHVTDGAATSNGASKSVQVSAANDAPAVALSGSTPSFAEDGPAVTVDGGVTVSDPDDANLESARLEVTTGQQSGDTLTFDAGTTGITDGDASAGVLALTGSASKADWETVLQSVEFETSSQNPGSSRTIAFKVNDGDDDSATVNKTLTVVSSPDPPVVTTGGTLAYTENDPATVIDSTITISDDDDTSVTGASVAVTTGHQADDDVSWTDNNLADTITLGSDNATTDVLTLTGSGTLAQYEAALEAVKYAHLGERPTTPKTIAFTASDSQGSSAPSNVTVNVTEVHDNPQVTTTGSTLTFTEGDAAKSVDSGVTVTEVEGDDIASATTEITAGAAADVLAWNDNNLSDNITQDTPNSTPTKVVLTGVGTAGQYTSALQAVTFHNASQNPAGGNRTVTLSVTDVRSDPGQADRTVNVVPVDDPPVALNDSATVLEDAAATAVPVLTNDTDVDAGQKTISSATDPAQGTVVLTGGNPGEHTGLTYQPDPNFCNDPPGTTPDTFTYTLNGGSNATVSMTVTCVNDAPVAGDETFSGANSAVGNTTFVGDDPTDGAPTTPDPTDTAPVTDRPHKTISANILFNDSDVDGPGPLTVTPGTFATNDGGSVTVQSDGDFTFEPAVSTSCTDTSDFFDYTVEDSGSPEQTGQGTVTIAITGCTWYVNNDDAQGDSGTSEKPFDTLAQAQSASGSNHSIFVFDGNNTTSAYDAGIDLKSNQKLIGEAATLTVGSDTLHSADAANRPTLTDTGADVIDLDDGNVVRGFNIDPGGTGRGIFGTTGDTGGTIDDVTVNDTATSGVATGAGIELAGTNGTWNLSGLDVTTGDATGLRLSNAGTVNVSGGATLTAAGEAALSATGTSTTLNGTFTDVETTGSDAGGVVLANLASGSSTTFNGLTLKTTSGSTAAFQALAARTVTVPPGANATLDATGGPALDVQNTPGLTATWQDVDSTNSSTDGINWDGNGAATFSAPSGSAIKGASGIGIDVNGGSGNFTFGGGVGDPGTPTPNDGTGQTADITGRTGGTVLLSGSLFDDNDAGGGISVSGNSGGASIQFTGASKKINAGTGTADAINLSNNAGAQTQFSGGNLELVTDDGDGIDASGTGPTASTGGALQVSGTGNTATATGGRALRVVNTNILDSAGGVEGLQFEKLSASGGPNGIVLDNTGTTGALTVQGNSTNDEADDTDHDADGSGGLIENTTSHAISLANTQDVSLDNLNVTSPQGAGLTGTEVTNLSYTDATISNAGAAQNVGDPQAAFDFNQTNANNLDGVLNLRRNVVQNPYGGGLQVRNQSGVISNAVITDNTITSTTSAVTSKEDGISIGMFSGASNAPELTKANIDGNVIRNFPSGGGIELTVEQTASPGGLRPKLGDQGDSTKKVVINDNRVSGFDAATRMAVTAIAVNIGGVAEGNVEITNNGTAADPVGNTVGQALGVGASGSSIADVVVINNVFKPNNGLGGAGASVSTESHTVGGMEVKTPALRATIQSNTISGSSGPGLVVQNFPSNGSLFAKILNNNVGAPAQPNNNAILLNNGGGINDAANAPTMCLDVKNNTATGNPAAPASPARAGIHIVNRENGSGTWHPFGFVGLTPINNASGAQTSAYVSGHNPGSSMSSGFTPDGRATVNQGAIAQFDGCNLGF